MPRLGMSYTGIVMPFSTCLAVAPSDGVRRQLQQAADVVTQRIQLCGLKCSAAKLGDWPVVRTPWLQHIFLWSGDKVLDQSGDLQYQLDFVIPSFDRTGDGCPQHKGVLLQHSFYHMPGLGAIDANGWCSWTRTGWPHHRVFVEQAQEALRRDLLKDANMNPQAKALVLA